MKKFNFLVALIIFVQVSFGQTAQTVQQRLNAGESPLSIYNSNTALLDSLYGKNYGGGALCFLNTTNGSGYVVSYYCLYGYYTWENAIQACKASDQGGYSDWFLPNKLQFMYFRNVIDYESSKQRYALTNYWTSSSKPDYAWYYKLGMPGKDPFTIASGNAPIDLSFAVIAMREFDGPKIQNNSIYVDSSQVICASPGTSVNINFILSKTPTEGFESDYTYNWQSKTDGSNWTNTGVTTINYNGNVTMGASLSTIGFRRIVTSGITDTSNSVYFNLMPSNFNQEIQLVPVQFPSNETGLIASLQPEYGNYTVYWEASADNGYSWLNKINFDFFPLTLDQSTTNIYRAGVQYNTTCPIFYSKNFSVSPPDGDGNIYPTILIGNQNWMMMNMRSTKNNASQKIALVKDDSTWNNTVSPAYCWHRNDSIGNYFNNGALYNNYATQNLCPVGWKVPSLNDWLSLAYFIGGKNGVSGANKLKVNDFQIGVETFANTNFGANPSGSRSSNGLYYGKEIEASWWASHLPTGVLKMKILSGSNLFYPEDLSVNPFSINEGHSVRCLQELSNPNNK